MKLGMPDSMIGRRCPQNPVNSLLNERLHSIVGVLRVASPGRGPVEVEPGGEQAGSMLPAEEREAFINLLASQRGAMRPLV